MWQFLLDNFYSTAVITKNQWKAKSVLPVTNKTQKACPSDVKWTFLCFVEDLYQFVTLKKAGKQTDHGFKTKHTLSNNAWNNLLSSQLHKK